MSQVTQFVNVSPVDESAPGRFSPVPSAPKLAGIVAAASALVPVLRERAQANFRHGRLVANKSANPQTGFTVMIRSANAVRIAHIQHIARDHLLEIVETLDVLRLPFSVRYVVCERFARHLRSGSSQ